MRNFGRIAYNGLGICDGAAIAFRQPSYALKLNRITEVGHLTSSRTIANTLLVAVFFLPRVSHNCLIS